jgi:hypothetical protein
LYNPSYIPSLILFLLYYVSFITSDIPLQHSSQYITFFHNFLYTSSIICLLLYTLPNVTLNNCYSHFRSLETCPSRSCFVFERLLVSGCIYVYLSFFCLYVCLRGYLFLTTCVSVCFLCFSVCVFLSVRCCLNAFSFY